MEGREAFACDGDIIHEDMVKRVREAMPDGKSFYDLANLNKMFADNTRVQILWALSFEGNVRMRFNRPNGHDKIRHITPA